MLMNTMTRSIMGRTLLGQRNKRKLWLYKEAGEL